MSRNFTNFRDIAEPFWEIESKLNLLEYEIDGIKIWQVVRMEVYGKLLSDLLSLDESHKTSTVVEKLKNSKSMIYNSIFNNPIFSEQCDIVIFPHDRVIKVEDEYIDIYTHYLIDNLDVDKQKVLILEKPYGQLHFTKKKDNKKYLDYSILLNGIKVKFFKNNKQLDNKYLLIQNELKKVFGLDIDIKDIFIRNLSIFKNYYKYYFKLLKKIQPKQIYLVVSYAYPWLIKVAKDLNIESIELQHGTFSKYHLGYSYPFSMDKIAYFPDKFLVWNGYWKDLIPLPINKKNIEIIPFEFQRREIAKYKNLPKIKNQVIVLSQGPISNMLAKVILDNFEFFKNKTIKYKLHPGEFQRYKEYNYLTKLNSYDNVEIVLESDLYELLAQSEYQVGVSSTALYEGLEFNLKTILADLPSVEYMEKLILDEKIDIILKENIE